MDDIFKNTVKNKIKYYCRVLPKLMVLDTIRFSCQSKSQMSVTVDETGTSWL